MKNTSIKKWYSNAFPTDKLGCKLNENVTFDDLTIALNDSKDVYELLGVGDSIVRERVFEKLSEIMLVDPDYAYKQWLKTGGINVKKKHKTRETTLKYLKDNVNGAELSVINNRLATIADALETGQWTKEDAIEELRSLSKG